MRPRVLDSHHPIDELGTSTLFWNYLTLSDGLLTVYEVALEFESSSLLRAGHCEPYSPWKRSLFAGAGVYRSSLARAHQQQRLQVGSC